MNITMLYKIFASCTLASLVFMGAGCANPNYGTNQGVSVQQSVAAPKSEESAIENLGLSEFSADNNTANTVTPQDKALAEEMMPVFKGMGDGKDATKNQETILKLGKIISKYPEYSDAYLLRATISLLANNADYSRIQSDIDSAIKFHSSNKYHSAYDSTAEMYALRAKVGVLNNSYDQAISDLETAIKIDPSNTNEVFNTGGIKPEENSNPSALQKNELDALIAKYPDDYRTYMFRGLFYRSFARFDEQYFTPTLNDLKHAQQLNPSSQLVEYLLGSTYQNGLISTKAAWADISDLTGATGGYKEKVYVVALQHFQKASELDSGFALAYAGAAESLYDLKRYSEAIPYYDKEIDLDPNNAGAYNDRGLSKTYINDYNGAIKDFSKAIDLKKSKPDSVESSYENRAAAYAKAMNYDSAIQDYGSAIGQKFGSLVLLLSLPQIRAIYPELSNISDQDLLEGLRQKYFSNMSGVDFSDQIKKNTKPYEEFILGGLYVARGDVYLSEGNFDKAQNEYVRAAALGSAYLVDDWKKSPALQTCLEKTDDPLGVNGGDQQRQRQSCLDQFGKK